MIRKRVWNGSPSKYSTSKHQQRQELVIIVKMHVYIFVWIAFESLAKDYEIPRSKLQLETIIGQGQFGDVHRGTYISPVSN